MKTQTRKILPFTLALTALALNLSLLQPVQAQTWATNSPLKAARWAHTATLLTNGTVLIAGGTIYNVSGNFADTNACELYDPVSGTTSLTAPMQSYRHSHRATRLVNGQVLITGGSGATSELYDPAGGTWLNLASMNAERIVHTATLLPNGKVLAAGGYNDNSGQDLSSAELYDPVTGTWTPTASMPYPADTFAAVLLTDGTVLVCGGSDASDGIYYETNAAIYNPATQTWTSTASMNEARAGHTATLLADGKVLVVGGNGDNTAEIYDPVAKTWSFVSNLNDGWYQPNTVLLPNGQVMVLGDGNTDVELYDPAADTWTYTDSLPVPGHQQTATVLPDGAVVVTGGSVSDYNGPPLAAVETYNQTASFGFALNTTDLTWSTGGDLPWFTETNVTLDGLAAQSGPITDSQSSYLETTVPADGQLSFNWKVSSEGNQDFLTFYINGNEQDAIADDVDWYQETYPVSAGDVLRWEYSKDGGGSDGLDAGFLDEVSYVMAPPTPGLTVTASPLTGPAPLTVQFTSPGMDSFGNTVTNWNWNFGDGTTSTAQSPSHIYTNFGSFAPSLAAYSTYGASPLSITGPGTITVTNHTLNVTANPQAGSLPLTVQFSSPGVDSGGNTVTNWNWNFGDGGTSTAQNPSHVYTTASTFSPSLVARSTYNTSPLDITGLSSITTTNPPNPNFRTLYSFPATSGSSSTNGYGSGPNGGLVLIGNNLYGTTQHGGGNGGGTLFSINIDGSSFLNWYNFSFANGAIPPDGVILSGSTFYGATYLGGTRSGGTIFAISTNGTGNTNLLNYNGNVDPNSGDEPQSGVVLADKTLYNTTWFGGAFNHGTISYVTTNGVSSGIFHHFSTPSGPNFNLNGDGLFPSSKLIFSNGTLYGTAEGGGTSGRGTVFAVDTNNPGSFRVLHHFTATDQSTGTNTDGGNPFAGVVLSGNTLYGTTFDGGRYGYGTVFAVNTDGSGFTNLYSFTGTNGAYGPHSGLTLSGNTLYGTTSGGGLLGALSSGTLFAINTDGSGYRSLYSFSGSSDGAAPQGDLIVNDNTLYGTTAAGGSSGNGIIFSFTLPSSILLTNPIKSGGSFQFGFLNTSGSTNTVFATTNLTLAFTNWTLLGTATEVSSGHFQFTDPQATNNSKRFYRVRSP